jgi:cell fate regulator YaaT (PSP1 superfamily)
MVATVKLNEVGRRYLFDTNNLELGIGSRVVVETIRGLELGSVVSLKQDGDIKVSEEALVRNIIRVATNDDIENNLYNISLEPKMISDTKALIKQYYLEMKILSCVYTLDRKKVWIYYESELRVDFRELLRGLTNLFPGVRVELRQVHTRDSAKILGGIGACGYITCCSSFLVEFDSITMKDAKKQDLKLNPEKLSGNCGKLLCCIKYEEDYYIERIASSPAVGTFVKTPRGNGKIIDINYISSKILVRFEDAVTLWFNYSEKGITE